MLSSFPLVTLSTQPDSFDTISPTPSMHFPCCCGPLGAQLEFCEFKYSVLLAISGCWTSWDCPSCWCAADRFEQSSDGYARLSEWAIQQYSTIARLSLTVCYGGEEMTRFSIPFHFLSFRSASSWCPFGVGKSIPHGSSGLDSKVRNLIMDRLVYYYLSFMDLSQPFFPLLSRSGVLPI
ncbi:uncharacterized protein BO95DRAFT_127923 [Aspergillus brunneoviolaceus CBS 621.78]|uniref:Uncharacterized protein n=1 Tax=Aspergillus brunneoviolaceus CBS 621.78 TaxID=1450534 RepID=A0ACD1G9M5_9EURO|nr:hypothetical protein BO95DRAFT_127923 [Aspergillus brunneoviolaceus CBS 621.78]RAH45954.1 hypothetical protein BO95DRAFT_127923 [Aspergillus brunneoviolaceus CBS 621.78]